jgi:hypothetical protein
MWLCVACNKKTWLKEKRCDAGGKVKDVWDGVWQPQWVRDVSKHACNNNKMPVITVIWYKIDSSCFGLLFGSKI